MEIFSHAVYDQHVRQLSHLLCLSTSDCQTAKLGDLFKKPFSFKEIAAFSYKNNENGK